MAWFLIFRHRVLLRCTGKPNDSIFHYTTHNRAWGVSARDPSCLGATPPACLSFFILPWQDTKMTRATHHLAVRALEKDTTTVDAWNNNSLGDFRGGTEVCAANKNTKYVLHVGNNMSNQGFKSPSSPCAHHHGSARTTIFQTSLCASTKEKGATPKTSEVAPTPP